MYKVQSKALIELSRVIEAHRLVDPTGIPEDPLWIEALPGVGNKLLSMIMYLGFDKQEVVAVDSHVFGTARGTHICNDGDVKEEMVALALQQFVPKDLWYLVNMEIASMGQILDRAPAHVAQAYVDALLDNDLTRRWIVTVCTCPLYYVQACKFVEKAVEMDESLRDCVQCRDGHKIYPKCMIALVLVKPVRRESNSAYPS